MAKSATKKPLPEIAAMNAAIETSPNAPGNMALIAAAVTALAKGK